MRAKVSDEGLYLPAQWFDGVTEVAIQKEQGVITITPVDATDPIFQIGNNPATISIEDASVNHDAYLYG